jgi:hypothetical protein
MTGRILIRFIVDIVVPFTRTVNPGGLPTRNPQVSG